MNKMHYLQAVSAFTAEIYQRVGALMLLVEPTYQRIQNQFHIQCKCKCRNVLYKNNSTQRYDAIESYMLHIDYITNPVPEPEPWIVEELHYGGNGIYAPTGNFSATHTDMVKPAQALGINTSRTYNSKDERTNTGFGKGWSFSYEGSCLNPYRKYRMSDGTLEIIKDTTMRVVRLPDGSIQKFQVNGSSYTALDSRNTLTGQPDGTFVMTTKDQTRYGFNSSGYLIYIQDRNGNTVNIQVNESGKVTGITDCVRRHFTVTYNAQGFIDSIADDTGARAVTYGYDGDKLITATDAEGKVIRYVYYPAGDPRSGYLKEIRDIANNLVQAADYYATGEQPYKVNTIYEGYKHC